METGIETGTETFGSLTSADKDTEKEAAGPEVAGPEKPVKPLAKKSVAPRPGKPIKNPKAAGPETPAGTPAKEDALPTKATWQHPAELLGLLRCGGQQ
jgi:hypothetical protein